jgi:hypothetical protein
MVSTFEKYFMYYCFFYDLEFDDLELVFNNSIDYEYEKKSLQTKVAYYNKKIMNLIF